MALDPLKFKIAIDRKNIQDDLKEARKTLMEGLKDVPITVKIANLKEVEKQLQNIEVKITTSGGGKGGGLEKEIKSFEELKKAAESANKTMADDPHLRNYMRNIETIDVAIRKLTASQKALQEAETMGSSAGKDTTHLKNRVAETQKRIDQLNELKKQVDLLISPHALTSPQNLGSYAAVWKEFSSFLTGSGSMVSQMRQTVEATNQVEKAVYRMTQMKERLDKSRDLGGRSGFGVSSFGDYSKIEEWMRKANAVNTQDATAVRQLMMDYFRLSQAIKEAQKAQDALNKSGQKQKDRDTAKNARELKKITDEANKAAIEITRLEIELRKLEKASAKGQRLGLDTSNLDGRIEQLRVFITLLERVRNMETRNFDGVGYRQARMLATEEMRELNKLINEEERARKRSASSAQQGASATRQLTAEEQKLAQAIQQTINQMNRQSQVLSDLKTMAMQYLSIYAGQQFLNNIIEIGGQLEMQRLSIGAILQDTAHANDLFDKIKSLALQSPFGVVELDQYTKQLSAYGFKYNELYDMTKRLADISAGAGTDVSRLALALGHVRSEGALTGYTLRQFAMNNIPMLGELSKKLSELEGRIVTAGEIRKRVSKKEIDYSMVESVIKGLTNEGGMFYNMQEVISGSTKAKWKNLRDAFDVMYGEMAESSVGGALKGTATMLTDLAKQWKTVGTVVLSVAGTFGLMKTYMLAQNALLSKQTVAVLKTVAAERQAEISKLRLATCYRTLTNAEMKSLAMGTQLRQSDIQAAISARKLTAEQLAKAVALGKVDKAMALNAIRYSQLQGVERSMMFQTVKNTQVLGVWGRTMYAVRTASLALGDALRTLLLNPMTWIMAAVSAVMYLWQKNSEEMDRASEVGKKMAERASEGVKNARSMMFETGISKGDDGSFTHTPSSQMSGDAMMQTMERWENYIKDYAATPNEILKNAFYNQDGTVRSLAEQYETLAKAVEDTAKSYEKLGNMSDIVENAINSTNGEWGDALGIFNDDIITNINDYSKSMRKLDGEIVKWSTHRKKMMVGGLELAKSDKAFADAVSKANEKMQEKEHRNLNETEQLRMLFDGTTKYTNAVELFNGVIGSKHMDSHGGLWGLFNKNESAADDYNTLMEDIREFADTLNSQLDDIGAKGEDRRRRIIFAIKETVNQATGATDAIRREIMKLTAEEIGIDLDIDEEQFIQRKSQIQEELDKLAKGPNGEGYPIDIRGVVDVPDLVQKVREAYKKAKDVITNMQPIAIKMGISIGGLASMTDEQIKSAAGGSIIKEMALKAIQKAQKEVEAAEKASNTYGFSLIDPTSGGKVFKPKKGKTSSESKEDKQAKEWKERIRQIKDARQWYQKWEKEVGETSALKKVKEIFKGLINPNDIKTLEAYERVLKGIRAQAAARKGKKEDLKASEVIRQVDDELANIDMLRYQRDSELLASNMKKELDDLTRRWEIYNDVLKTTGEREKAMRIAGFTPFDTAFNTRSSADALKNEVDSMLMIPNFDKMVDYGSVLGMSEKEIEDYVKNLLSGTGKYQDRVKAVAQALTEWAKREKDARREAVSTYSQVESMAADYGSQIARNNAMLDEQRRHLQSLRELGAENGGISEDEYQKAIDRITADTNHKNLMLTAQYFSILNHSLGMTETQLQSAAEAIERDLNERLKNGLISAGEYADEMNRLGEIIRRFKSNGLFGRNSDAAAFVRGGVQGLMSRYTDQLAVRRALLAESGYSQKEIEEDEEVKRLKELRDKLQVASDSLDSFATILDFVTGILNGLADAAQSISDMFDALGHTGSANTWSDIADGINAVTSGVSSLSKGAKSAANGDIGGLISGVVGSVTSPITAFAQLHDKRRERQIENLREDVQKINNTLNLIRTTRDRTLGYDNGDYRRMLASMYGNSLMADYYSRGGLNGSGYAQELAALKQQRQDYIEMYDAEDSKKKSSSEALEEYRVKIAELDDQIMNFSQDLAQQLWAIDLKGWADQIGDALMNAFENGKSAANAFEDATRNIMQSVVSEMLKVGFMEPMLAHLKDKLFGESGAFDPTNPQASMGAVLSELGRFFGEGGEGQMMMVAGEEFLKGAEELLKKNFGISLKNGSSSSNQTNSIHSQATEESVGIISGQLARMAQDLSVNRIFITQFVTAQVPAIMEKIDIQQTATANQLQSVRAIERMLMDGDGAMYRAIYRMSQKIDRAITAEGRMKVE